MSATMERTDLGALTVADVMVRDVITALTPEQLESTVTRTEPGWPQRADFPIVECLWIVLIEEWQHRLYAERDLDALEAQPNQTKEN